jgi:hypothetical protein
MNYPWVSGFARSPFNKVASEDELTLLFHIIIKGDLRMFIIRALVYTLSMIHIMACLWHRISCESYINEPFFHKAPDATYEICYEQKWTEDIVNDKMSPLFRNEWNDVLEHYCVSLYWGVVTCFRLG